MAEQRRRASVLLNWLRVERHSDVPLYRQIADQIRDAILTGGIGAGQLLPASRALALNVGVSRITTLQTFDQLAAEGFLETRRGSGTRIAIAPVKPRFPPPGETFRPRHAQEVFGPEPHSVAFQPAIPAFDAFPRLRWSRLLHRHGARNDQPILDYTHVGGYGPLRQEVARYLRGSRGVACRPEQVIVVSSTRAAVAAICAVLLRPGTAVGMEEPGYGVVRRVVAAAGHRVRYARVDARGLRVADLAAGAEPCAGVYVTPAHQWPTGVTLSAERRIDLLDWASRTAAWIIEDDYDSEFRFDSPPVATLSAFGGGRVVYVGTFSKTLAPAIRTAYLVAPADAVDRFEHEIFQRGFEPPLCVQAALADFLAEGDFTRHVARMRKLYARRRDLLVGALRTAFGDRLAVDRPPGGLQLIATLPDEVPAEEVSRRAAEADIVARPMANWYVDRPAPNALQLGFAAVHERDIAPGVARLRAAVAELF